MTDIEKIKEQMCDDYCKYPICDDVTMEEMHDICENCPLNKLEGKE